MSIRNRTQNTVWEVPQRRSKFFWKTLHLFHKQNLFCKISCIQYVFTPSLFFSIDLFIGDTGWRHALFFRQPCPPSVWSVLTARMPEAYAPYARFLEGIYTESGKWQRPFTLYCRWIGYLIKKRWSRWKGQKIYRKDILKNKKHSPEKRCYIFFWNLHIFPLKPVTSFFKRCYVFLKKMLRLQADKSC